MSLNDTDTFFSPEEDYRDDADRPAELDVLSLTEDMYKEIFNGPEPPKDVWYVAFIRKKRSMH